MEEEDTDTGQSQGGPRRSFKDWSKFSNTKTINNLEYQWQEDGEDPDGNVKWVMGADGQARPGPPKQQTQMMFVVVDPGDEGITALNQRFVSLLVTVGVDTKSYPVEDDTLLFTLDNWKQALKVKEFALQQPEVDHVTWDQQDYYAPGKGAKAMSHNTASMSGMNNIPPEYQHMMPPNMQGGMMPPNMPPMPKNAGGKARKKEL